MSKVNKYNRADAVKYALQYGQKPNPAYRHMEVYNIAGGDCTNFVSQCLRAGGAPMAFGTSRPWWYDMRGGGENSDHRWSVSWAVAHSLYWCLKVRHEKKMSGLCAMEVSDISMLEPGDVIQYENSKGTIYHSAIVTDFAYLSGKQVPLITQHTFNAVNIPYIKSAAKKMHFMKVIVT